MHSYAAVSDYGSAENSFYYAVTNILGRKKDTNSVTMDINPISNYSIDEHYRQILSVFRIYDLKTLLGAFGQSRSGRKFELRDRAIKLLRTRPANINYSAYIAKIHEIYRFLQSGMSNYNIMMRSSLIQNRQQQPQRMYQPPLFPQPSMHMARVVLPQVMPQRQGINYIRCIAVGPSKIRCIVSNQLHPNQQMSIVAQNALEVGTTASRNNSYTPSIEAVAQIKYKKLPFYEVIDEVIKPTLLTGTDTCTLPNVHEGMKEAIFKVTLSPEQANVVADNCKISSGKEEYLYQFQIRICQLIEPIPNESPDYMPLDLYIRVGRKPCQLPPSLPITSPGTKSRLTARPIDCTANVKLCPFVSNTITIRWTPDGKNYVFSMYLVKKLTSDTLIKRLHDKGGRSSEDTRNIIIQMFANIDPDVATTSYRFSLICPLSKVRMKIPAKSIYCDHLQCFDVSTFILMNEKKPTWMCPTCSKPCLYDDIQIENYFLEVVSSPTLKYCTTEIEILSDGTWRIHKETIETKNTNSTFDMVKSNDIVDLDSDDEMCTERNAGPSPKNSKSSFIDLTLSDDEGLQA
ncbi:hypothetical protein AGLY_017606 [Aphis glycines]|uniref:SP-RING-type domain-containing protein n=2 Tax=Aphis glycines TaxID=307491 RepID=A0A6G0SWC3_APHGL|nr:hypothetical protein AGLY_017606 [Aphis glycines]